VGIAIHQTPQSGHETGANPYPLIVARARITTINSIEKRGKTAEVDAVVAVFLPFAPLGKNLSADLVYHAARDGYGFLSLAGETRQ